MSSSRPSTSSGPKQGNSKALNDYQLGDSLGKGAFGQVYRALNMATGETVAVKEIQLSNIPKAELPEIQSEIDLLKNLNHPNIVKYKGFVKTRDYLYIILEFCENGSLHNILKKFGKFPEVLVAFYIYQVLEGLVYLHDEGVIHRDIKGANILTNKDGTVKLADFGVAAKTGGAADGAVVGSPYWMAPEVIEQSGATTASDIWSVGCLVIELLEGHPPYHTLDPMPALFRIVQDDCPPIPEGCSPIVKDFLYHCFQKDSNLRISGKKLLRHPWMLSTRKQMANGRKDNGTKGLGQGAAPGEEARARRTSNYGYDEAVLKVQEWNEALRSPSKLTKPGPKHPRAISPFQHRPPVFGPDGFAVSTPLTLLASSQSHHPASSTSPPWNLKATVAAPSLTPKAAKPAKTTINLVEKIQPHAFVLQPPEEQTDNWDDDFEDGISLTKLQALEKVGPEEEKPELEDNAQTIRPSSARGSPSTTTMPLPQQFSFDFDPIEDYSDLAEDEDDTILQAKVAGFKSKNAVRRGLFHPDDIKTYGIAGSQGPFTAPLPLSLSRKSSRTSLNGSTLPSMSSGNSMTGQPSHSRSNSVSGSLGRAEAQKMQEEFDKYAEEDDDDYEDVFGKIGPTSIGQPMQTLQLHKRLSSKSWLGDDSDEEDPFAEIDEGFDEDDLEANLQRDKYARLTNTVNGYVDQLSPSAPDFQLREACDQLSTIMSENPEMQGQLVSAHGMLAILEVLEGRCARDVVLKLLQIVNMLVTEDVGFLESFCLIGGIPVMMEFTSKKYSSECRLEASNFIRLLCHTSVLTLQMFISCRGLKTLVDLLDEDYSEQRELVEHALNGIGSVFELQSPTTKNDFCRMFIREGLLDPLSAALLNVMAIRGSPETLETKMKVIQILLVFSQVSQNDIHVRNALGTRKVVRRLLRACELLEPECLVQMLKAVKHLSMNATLHEVLQNANALEILIRILEEHTSGPQSAEIANNVFQTCYNLCRLNKSRQEEAAQAGIIPCLKRVISSSSPLKQFALPILCDLASAGKSCRTLLWQHDGLGVYLGLLSDPYFQVGALEAVLSWLQDEPARVEDELVKPAGLEALVACFVGSKANSFENLLDPFLKMVRLSTPITLGIARFSAFFKRITERLGDNGSTGDGKAKAVVRLNLLKLLRSICEVHPNRSVLVEKYGLLGVVERLSKTGGDGAVLVKELAREMIPVLKPALRPVASSSSSSGKTSPAEAVLAPRQLGEGRKPKSRGSQGGSLDFAANVSKNTTPQQKLAPKRLRRSSSDASRTPLTSPAMRHLPSKSIGETGATGTNVKARGLVPVRSSLGTSGLGVGLSRQRLGEIQPWQSNASRADISSDSQWS